MNSKNKLAEMPIRSLLYTMAIPLMLSLIVQSLYNIVDSIFVAKLSETAQVAFQTPASVQKSLQWRTAAAPRLSAAPQSVLSQEKELW